MLTWDLENWISDVGADLIEKRSLSVPSLTRMKAAVYEI